MATGKTHSRYTTIDIDDYANVIRDISPSITDVSIPRTYETQDVTGYSDGAINFQLGPVDAPLTMQGFFDSTALVGGHTVLSKLVGVIETSVTITIQFGIRAVPAGGNPEYEGLFYCKSLVYGSDLAFTAEFVPATTTAPGWTTV